MDAKSLGKQLYRLCKSREDKFAEVEELLDDLTDEDLRREVVSYQDNVSIRFDNTCHAIHLMLSLAYCCRDTVMTLR